MRSLPLLFISFLALWSHARGAQQSNHDVDQDNREMLSSIISIADKIQNAVPTVPTTPFPTVSPTISAAPSPSPSATPTNPPTLSMAPSIQPTIAPTVSAAPTLHPTVSPAPSSTPSAAPTELPSSSPSQGPTLAPTLSPAPSSMPSSGPTDYPSSTPSVAPTERPSLSPSSVPSDAPSVSAAPTLMYYETMRATTTVRLPAITAKMNATQLETFEGIVKEFLQWNMDDVDGSMDITSVTVLSQKLIVDEGEDTTSHNNRQLQLLTYSGLDVEITTTGDYESLIHPDDFDFQMTIQDSFKTNFALLRSNLLDTGDEYFAPLDPTIINKNTESSNNAVNSGLSRGGYAAIIFCSILFSIMAIVASCYAIRKAREENKKGDKLSEMNMYDDPVGSNLTQESMGPSMKNSKSVEIIQVSDSPEKSPEEQEQEAREQEDISRRIEINTTPGATPSKEDFTELISMDHVKREQVVSPNTMETGGRMGALAESILRNESFGSSRDPPESAGRFSSYGGPKSKGDPAARYRPETYHNLPRPESSRRQQQAQDEGFAQFNRSSSSGSNSNNHNNNMQSRQRDPSVAGASQFNNGNMINSFFPKESERRLEQRDRTRSAGPIPGDSTSEWMSEESQDVALTVGRNGKLGAAPIPNKNQVKDSNKRQDQISPSSSAVSSSINAFLNMVGGGIGTLGAAPLSSSPPREAKKEEHNKSFHDIMQREGLYDVLAPSGALGIVVDTTKEGPAVHSLKQTSPMLGLINPGDLIVGLDSQDTRSMTAATLTRLMASKSHQRERKITLLASDNY